jgi:hypothetical protein
VAVAAGQGGMCYQSTAGNPRTKRRFGFVQHPRPEREDEAVEIAKGARRAEEPSLSDGTVVAVFDVPAVPDDRFSLTRTRLSLDKRPKRRLRAGGDRRAWLVSPTCS